MSQPVKIALIALQGVQVAFILLHDWVPLGRLSNLEAVKSSDSRSKLLGVTLLSTLPFALPFAVSCAYGRGPGWPGWLQMWLCYTYCISLGMVLYVWWLPYLFGTNPERAARYKVRFAGTMRFLPERHGFAPDTLHTLYHLTIVATVVLLFLQ